jgi:hypothetical protein
MIGLGISSASLTCALALRLATLKETKPSLLQIYEELIELMLELEVHWRGQSPEDQQRSAKDVREVLRECQALKERIHKWSMKQFAQRADGAKDALSLADRMKEFGKDLRRRHPKQGLF